MTESEDSRAPKKRARSAMTEAEQLRAEARRIRRLANAINDEKTTKNLEAYAAELLARADAVERQAEK